ncbi:HAMP domain-containing sensor histidine kinase [Paenibacillus sp. FSL L8-0340]|uniref:sensor histidine kinase n=1 Tax=Paenibacillus sp. FSL L8-0340 TaxID=2954685 RepID=UPI0031594DCE
MRGQLMGIMVGKNIKLLFTAIAAILLGALLAGQLTVKLMADDYKQRMLAHDYELAGYLTESVLPPHRIAALFTASKTGEQAAAGQRLLNGVAYNSDTPISLLPEVAGFQQKYALLLLALSVCFGLALLTVLLLFILRQNAMLKQANTTLIGFMEGNVKLRLGDQAEGSFSRLFTSINMLATSLTAHISRERQNKEFLRDIISDISHQLKTPLSALLMYGEIIQEERTGNDVVDKFASKSRRELLRMEHLIQSLLKLARLDAGAIALEQVEQPLRAVLEAAMQGFRTRVVLEGKKVVLTCREDIRLNCDKEWLLEAVSNIVKNALDHTEAGDKLEIAGDETPLFTEITITDNGTGIHPEDIHSVFKRFYQSRFSKDKQGAGIGLTLSRSIVEKHGGTITVESKLSKGTVFRIVFPKLTIL